VSGADPHAPRGVHHLAIRVRDLGRMEAFYREVLGLPVLLRWPATDGTAGERSVWLDTGDGAFLALERGSGEASAAADPAGSDRPGLHLVALRIERGGRAEWEGRLARAGVAIEARTAFSLYVRDPEGNRVGLSHWPDQAVD
jgi:glyoxylase I family protein